MNISHAERSEELKSLRYHFYFNTGDKLSRLIGFASNTGFLKKVRILHSIKYLGTASYLILLLINDLVPCNQRKLLFLQNLRQCYKKTP